MTEEELVKPGEAVIKTPIQIQTGDVEVAKLQLAARWAELSNPSGDVEAWLRAFSRAYKSIDETLRP